MSDVDNQSHDVPDLDRYESLSRKLELMNDRYESLSQKLELMNDRYESLSQKLELNKNSEPLNERCHLATDKIKFEIEKNELPMDRNQLHDGPDLDLHESLRQEFELTSKKFELWKERHRLSTDKIKFESEDNDRDHWKEKCHSLESLLVLRRAIKRLEETQGEWVDLTKKEIRDASYRGLDLTIAVRRKKWLRMLSTKNSGEMKTLKDKIMSYPSKFTQPDFAFTVAVTYSEISQMLDLYAANPEMPLKPLRSFQFMTKSMEKCLHILNDGSSII